MRVQKSVRSLLISALLIPAAAIAGDLNMGDYLFFPNTKAFLGTVRKVHRRSGSEQIDTQVLRVDRTLLGDIGTGKNVGIILTIPGRIDLAPVGSRIFVMTAGDRSPYKPLPWFHGFVPFDKAAGPILEKCLLLTMKAHHAAETTERLTTLKELALLPKPCYGKEVADHYAAAFCQKNQKGAECRKELGIE